ncbi:hypothetical protein BC939DRAFT_295047 [Gamsiella multidivaricata]|uniref:uncharacterized protein n=1 Tax=Gamsiella multidivaricata TaxID=101098 RepID=UPI00221F5615|nr:uncharacterized protein BC939DRAFT_295047 [Gamsiella multidivaricata]KAI7818326.1 hypothetical protein BC939DRAFT_295047 [Gamsiella multidivaricata]
MHPPLSISLALQPPSFHSLPAHSKTRLATTAAPSTATVAAATRSRRGSSSSLLPSSSLSSSPSFCYCRSHAPAVSSPLHQLTAAPPNAVPVAAAVHLNAHFMGTGGSRGVSSYCSSSASSSSATLAISATSSAIAPDNYNRSSRDKASIATDQGVLASTVVSVSALPSSLPSLSSSPSSSVHLPTLHSHSTLASLASPAIDSTAGSPPDSTAPHTSTIRSSALV